MTGEHAMTGERDVTGERAVTVEYAVRLADYLRSPDEAGLAAAYELGRAALTRDTGLVEIVVAHGAALRSLLGDDATGERSSAATAFLAECVAPLEMAYRGFVDANRELRSLNEELEHRVADRTRALQDANAELEAFGYSVSHDLRAPLRAIQGFSEILEEEHAAELGEEATGLLERVVANVERMRRLIDDLLALSRAGRAGMSVQPLEMDAIVRSVLDELREAGPGREVAVAVGPLAPAMGDPVLVRQVWANLLSNAFKFTATTAHPEIRVECEPGGTEVLYRVVDNGVGFDMAYVDKLFGVFQRLHGAEFPGSGIGLAIVKRVVARHGGRVAASGEVGRGASFGFTLPPVAPPSVHDGG